jgi:hypothetical protein
MRKKREWILEFRFRADLSRHAPYEEWKSAWSDNRSFDLEEATRELVEIMSKRPIFLLTSQNVKEDMLDIRIRNTVTDEVIPIEALGY